MVQAHVGRRRGTYRERCETGCVSASVDRHGGSAANDGEQQKDLLLCLKEEFSCNAMLITPVGSMQAKTRSFIEERHRETLRLDSMSQPTQAELFSLAQLYEKLAPFPTPVTVSADTSNATQDEAQEAQLLSFERWLTQTTHDAHAELDGWPHVTMKSFLTVVQGVVLQHMEKCALKQGTYCSNSSILHFAMDAHSAKQVQTTFASNTSPSSRTGLAFVSSKLGVKSSLQVLQSCRGKDVTIPITLTEVQVNGEVKPPPIYFLLDASSFINAKRTDVRFAFFVPPNADSERICRGEVDVTDR